MSIERGGNFRRQLTRAGASVACAAALVGYLPNPAGGETGSAAGGGDCRQYFDAQGLLNGEYRACVSYIVDAAEGSLQLYYKTAHSRVEPLADIAEHHLETRYFLGARATFEQMVASWGSGTNKVSDEIDLVSLTTSLEERRALITTREQWRVVNQRGKDLLPRALAKPHVEGHTLCYARQRILPSIPILKPYAEWLVVENTADPSFNCNDFAAKLAAGEIR